MICRGEEMVLFVVKYVGCFTCVQCSYVVCSVNSLCQLLLIVRREQDGIS